MASLTPMDIRFSQHRKTTCLVGIAGAIFCAFHIDFAQDSPIEFDRLTIQQGLSNNRVNAILQDRKGFIWFGTEGGLNRYDGYTVTSYGHLPMYEKSVLYEDSRGFLWLTAHGGRLYRFNRISETFVEYPSLGHKVHQVFEDSSRNLWVATWGAGLGWYMPASDSFRVFTHRPERSGTLPDDNVGVVCEDGHAQLLVGTESGISSFDRNRNEFHRMEGGPNNHVSSIMVDRHGVLWAGTNNGLCEIDRAHSRFVRHLNKSRGWNDMLYLYEDQRYEVWVASTAGISRFEPASNTFRNFEKYLPRELTLGITWPSIPIHEDRSGTLWSGVSSVLARFDRARQDFIRCSYEPQGPRHLETEITSTMYEDRTGRMWFGTMSRGAEWTDGTRKRFPDIRLSGTSPSVISILCDREGILWLGKPDGLLRVDLASGGQKHYMRDPSNPQTLSGNVISCIAEESPNTLWLGTYERGLNRFDKQTGVCTRFMHDDRDPSSLGNDNIGSLLTDIAGDLWVGSNATLDRLRRGSRSFEHFPIESGFITCLLEDQSNMLWIGTSDGLYRFNKRTSACEHFPKHHSDLSEPTEDPVNSILQDLHGDLWIGTDLGLIRRATNGSVIGHITVKEGLANDKIIGILEDAHESLWLLTPKGISQYTPATERIRNYDAHDGVRLEAALYSPYFKDTNGEMFFGGFSGLIRFHPDSIRDNPNVPVVVITLFKKFEQKVQLDTAITEKRTLELSYRDNVFSFEFAALNCVSAEKNQYAYMLEGFDDHWIYSGTKRTATYTNLDGGLYTFRVKGSNNDGIWNEEGTSAAVIVSTPPWKTTWAYMAYVLIVGGMLYGIRHYQINKLKVRHELEMTTMEASTLREVDQMKSRFFANISHEFRTPLTLILGPVGAILATTSDGKVRQDLGMIQRNARRLLTLVNQLLDLSRVEGHRMKLSMRKMDLVELVRGIAASFESLAVRRSIQLTVIWSEPIAGYFDGDVVEKILTNLLSNAFKFTSDGGQVSVTVGRQDSSIYGEQAMIDVSDTGIGIPSDQLEKIFDRFHQIDGTHTREHEGTGIGLALTKELVQLHKGHISVSSEPGRGSTFRISLPLGKGHLSQEEMTDAPAKAARKEPEAALSETEAADAAASEDDMEGESSDQGPVVLVIEDNKDMRRYIRDRLEDSYAVIEAENGALGFDEATRSVPDLIVSDVMMPKMDGFELCKRLKEDMRTSHIPIILLTAKAGTNQRIEGYHIGADDYLVKPFDADELAARIANLIEQRRLLRERFHNEIVLKPRDIAVTPVDEKFLNRVMTIVEEHMADSDFGTETMANTLFMSRMQLHRKLKALTGRSPHDFLRAMRLQRASELLRRRAGNISEIAYEVGFNNLSHFAKSFREQFGKSPSEFVETPTDPDR